MSTGAGKSAKVTIVGDATLDAHELPVAIELSAAEKLAEASAQVRKAREELEKLKGQYAPDQAAYRQCEDTDEHLFEALRLLGS